MKLNGELWELENGYVRERYVSHMLVGSGGVLWSGLGKAQEVVFK